MAARRAASPPPEPPHVAASATPPRSQSEPEMAVVAGLADLDDVVQGVVVSDPHRSAMQLLNDKFKRFSVVAGRNNSLLKMHNKLGEGTWSQVYAVQSLATGTPYALKMIAKHGAGAYAGYEDVQRMKRLRHKHIVEYHGYFTYIMEGVPFLCIKMDYCERGTVKQYIQQKQNDRAKASLATVCALTLQTAYALAYVHERGCLHGDLHTDNLLLTADKQVKLTGFADSSCGRPNAAEHDLLTVTGGLRTYAPPEWMSSGFLNRPLRPLETPLPSYDTWGLGCVLSELATLKLVGEDRLRACQGLAMFSGSLEALKHELASAFSGTFASLGAGLLAVDPEERTTAEGAVRVLEGLAEKACASWASALRRSLMPRKEVSSRT